MMQVLVRILFFIALLELAISQGFGQEKGIFNLGATHFGENARATATQLIEMFRQFKTTFKKSYSSPAEEKKRLGIFSNNFKKITELAKITSLPYKLKLNALADLTVEEFNKLLNGFIVPKDKKVNVPKVKLSNKIKFDVSKNFDWRDEAAVLPARNQEQCGSCYAFASVAALEALFFNSKKTETLEYLSIQNIIDCAKGYGTMGCRGGWPQDVFEYVKNVGINTETEYQYEKSEETCRYKKDKSVGKIEGYAGVDDSDGLEKAVRLKGPIVVGLDAHAQSFHFYSEGIYYEPMCNASRINHAVLLIGYGTEPNGDKYWLIKNSHSTSWGMDGFGKISRNESNHCGINEWAWYPF